MSGTSDATAHDQQRIDPETGKVDQPNQNGGATDPDSGETNGQGTDVQADSQEPSRPEQILQDRIHEDTISDEEAVLAYNANAEPENGAENVGAAEAK